MALSFDLSPNDPQPEVLGNAEPRRPPTLRGSLRSHLSVKDLVPTSPIQMPLVLSHWQLEWTLRV